MRLADCEPAVQARPPGTRTAPPRLGYVGRRVLTVVPAVLGVLTLTFLLVHAVPGDPAQVLAGEGADPARIEQIRQELGFDRPLPEQFLTYVGNVFRGDLGQSTSQGKPVTAVVAERVGPTLLLGGTALLLSTAGGLLLGAAAARRAFGRFDLGASTLALIGYAIPAFWLAQLAVLAFAVHLPLFPLSGYTDARAPADGLGHVAEVAYHLMLPALVLAASELALLTRVTRSGLLQELGQDYVRTARAKGLPEKEVVSAHALRNALLPVVTVLGTRIGFLFSGAVVIEAVFSWPGLGSVIVTAARESDRELMLGLVVLVAFCVIAANLVTDLLYAWIDPRVRVR